MATLPSKAERDSLGITTLERAIAWSALTLRQLVKGGQNATAIQQALNKETGYLTLAIALKFSSVSTTWSRSDWVGQIAALTTSSLPSPSLYQDDDPPDPLFPIPDPPIYVGILEAFLVWCIEQFEGGLRKQLSTPLVTSTRNDTDSYTAQVSIPFDVEVYDRTGNLFSAIKQVCFTCPAAVASAPEEPPEEPLNITNQYSLTESVSIEWNNIYSRVFVRALIFDWTYDSEVGWGEGFLQVGTGSYPVAGVGIDSGDCVVFPTGSKSLSPDLDFDLPAFTITTWLKVQDLTYPIPPTFGYTAGTPVRFIKTTNWSLCATGFTQPGNVQTIQLGGKLFTDSDLGNPTIPGFQLIENQWYLVAVAYSAFSLYVVLYDGSNLYKKSLTNGSALTDLSLVFGNDATSSIVSLDKTNIYPRLINDDEWQLIYNNGQGI